MSRYDHIDEREYARGRRGFEDDDEGNDKSAAPLTAGSGASVLGGRGPARGSDTWPILTTRTARHLDYDGVQAVGPSSHLRSVAPPLASIPPATLHPVGPSSAMSEVMLRPKSAVTTRTDTTDLSERYKTMALTSYFVRPGYGNSGRHLTVRSNFFQVRSIQGRGKTIYHYDVDMEPVVSRGANAKKPKGLLRAVWEQLCLEQSGEWRNSFQTSAYDGRRNAFTPNKLPISHGGSQTFIVAIAPDGIVHKTAREDSSSSDDEGRKWKVTLKLVNEISLQSVLDFCKASEGAPQGEEECLTGNRFFSMEGAHAISAGAVVCNGFMQSFRYSNSGLPLLNVDIGLSAFLADGPALEVIGKIIQRGRTSGTGGRAGRGGFARALHTPGSEISELTPFEIHLVKKMLRGVKVGYSLWSKTEEMKYGQKAFIPLEFIRLAQWNSLPPTKLNPEQISEMIKLSAVRPKERADAVMRWRAELDHDRQAKIAAWGLQVNNQMVQVNARILPPPQIVYSNSTATPLDGGWNLRGSRLICCILPGRDAWLYEQIKKSSFTELKGPVPTQCMQAAKIRSPQGIAAYTGNLIMKIQNKLGGLTHRVPLSQLPGMVYGKTMLLGGDLGLPSIKAGNESAPTVACTIATYNAECDLYSAQIRLQLGREETIADLSTMVEAHLKIFHKHNKCYPDRILIFRDGISEGQYAAVLTYEHKAVLQACQKLQHGYRPRLLLAVCAKRHNTRFFGRDKDVDRSGNLPSGLVVDNAVTHPYAFDFFLQSHSGRVGTARPTHYICLLDELPVTPDQLQQLVHSLCHSFARCTRSVSLVPVCYIADLVCQKARVVVHEPGTSQAPSVSSTGKSGMNRSRQTALSIDVMQIQKLLEKNGAMSEVSWWM
ncbi:hypothetical protein IAU60_002900 [Kwoniella sp. DSM 27419]